LQPAAKSANKRRMDNPTLDELGLKYRTDKSSGGHNYLTLYERYFAPIRSERVKILEIGVLNGASLAVWEEYFPNGTIIGADINNAVRRFARPRVEIRLLTNRILSSWCSWA